jgi:hypothetical protein
MWMTSSFLDKQRRALLPTALIICTTMLVLPSLAAVEQAPAPQAAPDSPRPSRTPSLTGIRGEGGGGTRVRPTVELKAVVVRRIDERMGQLAGPQFVKEAEEPYYIEVQTQASLGNLARSSAPVILLNGERLLNTRATGDHTLVAFLPNLKMLRDTNTVAVVWLGDQQTKTKRPLSFSLKDVAR